MYCDNCLNWKYCKELNLEDRSIMEFGNGTVWCKDKKTQEQVDEYEKLLKVLEKNHNI